MKATTLNLKASDFKLNGIEYITRKENIGYTSKYDKKFKAPKVVNIENVGIFTLKTYCDNELTGRRFFYQSEIFVEALSQSSLRIMFW
jgi:hypothetical protein